MFSYVKSEAETVESFDLISKTTESLSITYVTVNAFASNTTFFPEENKNSSFFSSEEEDKEEEGEEGEEEEEEEEIQF